MLLFLVFVVVTVLFLGVFYLLSNALVKRSQREGPATLANRMQKRNRLTLAITFLVLCIFALVEMIFYDFHSGVMLEMQYSVGDVVDAPPLGIVSIGNSFVSLGLYLTILAAAFAGIVAGTLLATRRYPILKGIGFGQII